MKVAVIACIIAVIVALIAWFCIYHFYSGEKKTTKIEISGKIITVEMADNQAKRIKGLSGRDSLEDNSGMLFIFPKSKKYVIWMKEMKFPIDIIWIRDNTVVYMVQNAPLPTNQNIPAFTPTEEANMLLEVSSGFVKANDVKIGEEVKIDKR